MESYYAYYSLYCVCGGHRVALIMRDLDGNLVSSWPVDPYNVNQVAIPWLAGLITNKIQYCNAWNSDADNQQIGVLSVGAGPFEFILTLNPGQAAPPWVIGEPFGNEVGIYEEQYESQYE